MSPAQYVVKIFGGVRETARLLNRSPSSVTRWNRYRGTGSTYGQIPIKVRKTILEIAAKKDLPISCENLEFGYPVTLKKKNVDKS